MTAAEFRAWMERRGLIPATAAPLLAAQPSEVSRWANGTRKVPPRIARIIELLESQPSAGQATCAGN